MITIIFTTTNPHIHLHHLPPSPPAPHYHHRHTTTTMVIIMHHHYHYYYYHDHTTITATSRTTTFIVSMIIHHFLRFWATRQHVATDLQVIRYVLADIIPPPPMTWHHLTCCHHLYQTTGWSLFSWSYCWGCPRLTLFRLWFGSGPRLRFLEIGRVRVTRTLYHVYAKLIQIWTWIWIVQVR